MSFFQCNAKSFMCQMSIPERPQLTGLMGGPVISTLTRSLRLLLFKLRQTSTETSTSLSASHGKYTLIITMGMADHFQAASMEEELSPPAMAAPSKAERTDIVRDKVFGTTELLEGILLHVADDSKTLLLSQRVSAVFHNTIEHSNSLQTALFSVKNSSTDPPIPQVLKRRKIKLNDEGATFRLGYEPEVCGGGMIGWGIDLSLTYEEMSATMRSQVDMYQRNLRVELALDMEEMLAPGQLGVEIIGSWQKMSLNIRERGVFGSNVLCRHAKWAWKTFMVDFAAGDTLGSIVDKALRTEKRH